MRRRYAQVFGVLAIGAVIAGMGVLMLSTRTMGFPRGWHGALLGVLVGLYGLCVFGIGALWNDRARRGDAPPEPRNGPAAQDAKFWLRKFLEEQQKNGKKYGA